VVGPLYTGALERAREPRGRRKDGRWRRDGDVTTTGQVAMILVKYMYCGSTTYYVVPSKYLILSLSVETRDSECPS